MVEEISTDRLPEYAERIVIRSDVGLGYNETSGCRISLKPVEQPLQLSVKKTFGLPVISTRVPEEGNESDQTQTSVSVGI